MQPFRGFSNLMKNRPASTLKTSREVTQSPCRAPVYAVRGGYMRQCPALLTLVALLVLVSACGGGGTTTGLPATVTILPSPVSLTWSTTQQLSASVTDTSSNALSNATFTYATSDSSIADVSTSGLVCAGAGTPKRLPSFALLPLLPRRRNLQGTVTVTASVPKSSTTASATVTVYCTHISTVW